MNDGSIMGPYGSIVDTYMNSGVPGAQLAARFLPVCSMVHSRRGVFRSVSRCVELFVCLFVCFFVCLFVSLFVCLFCSFAAHC